jgi:hypothetical protein
VKKKRRKKKRKEIINNNNEKTNFLAVKGFPLKSIRQVSLTTTTPFSIRSVSHPFTCSPSLLLITPLPHKKHTKRSQTKPTLPLAFSNSTTYHIIVNQTPYRKRNISLEGDSPSCSKFFPFSVFLPN